MELTAVQERIASIMIEIAKVKEQANARLNFLEGQLSILKELDQVPAKPPVPDPF